MPTSLAQLIYARRRKSEKLNCLSFNSSSFNHSQKIDRSFKNVRCEHGLQNERSVGCLRRRAEKKRMEQEFVRFNSEWETNSENFLSKVGNYMVRKIYTEHLVWFSDGLAARLFPWNRKRKDFAGFFFQFPAENARFVIYRVKTINDLLYDPCIMSLPGSDLVSIARSIASSAFQQQQRWDPSRELARRKSITAIDGATPQLCSSSKHTHALPHISWITISTKRWGWWWSWSFT